MYKPLADSILDLYTSNPSGLYMECGANDGIQQSNTLALEKVGWKGWLIDASRIAIERCKKNRSPNNVLINVVLTNPENDGKDIMGDFNGHLMGSVGGKHRKRPANISVKGITLSRLVKEYNVPSEIDLFVLDVEGHELEVIKGWGESFHPKRVIMEICYDTKVVEEAMNQIGYSLITNLTNFNKKDTPDWGEYHNDFLFEISNNL